MWPRNEYIILDVDQIRIRYVVHAKFCYQTCWISLKILTGVAFTLWENIWCVPISCWNARNLCVLVTPSVSNFLLPMDVHIWIAFAFWGLIHMPRNIGMISSHDEYSGFSRRFPLIIYLNCGRTDGIQFQEIIMTRSISTLFRGIFQIQLVRIQVKVYPRFFCW